MNCKMLLRWLFLPLLLGGLIGCQTMSENKIASGAAIGGVTGALAGGVIGHQSGHATEGALIGAAAGAAVGSGVGWVLDRQAKKFDEIEDVEVETYEESSGDTGTYSQGGETGGAVEPEPAHLTLRMDSEVLFEKGSSQIKPEGSQKLAEIAQVLRDYPDSKIMVKGYTSSEGGDAFNQDLSQRRADVVRNHLIANKVAPGRITAIGMGSSNPIASNDTEIGRMQNRRVEIDVFPSEEVR